MISLDNANILARTLLFQHNLHDWKVEFNRSPNILGQCYHSSKTIAISKFLIESANAAELSDTILHEIAHALVGPNKGHNLDWIAKAREIGCKPEACGKFPQVNNGNGTKEPELKAKKHIAPLTKKCPTCDQIAEEVSRVKFGEVPWVKLKCGHLVKKENLKGVDIDGWTSNSGKVIFPYQAEGIKFIASAQGRALIADEPGLGKTAQALGFLKFYPELALPCLWVCKTTLKMQAIKEALDWCGIEYMPCTIDSTKSYILPGMKMYVISMDLLRRIDTEKIKALGIKTLVVDEVQHFKNPDSARTQELRRLVEDVDYFIALSGTPWKNRGSEYFPVLNMLAPDRFPTYNGFQSQWVETYYDAKTGKMRQGGIRNIQRFREKTGDFIIRRMRDDVLPDLPKINRQIRYVELDKIYGDAYEKAEKEIAEIIKDIILEGKPMANIQGELMRLKHITGLAKVDAQFEDALEFLEETEDWQKLTIFHHHIDVGDRLEAKINEVLLDLGYNKAIRLRGGEDGFYRDSLVQKFKREEKSRIMIASTLASGEGLNLQFCQCAAQMERQWNPQNEEQAELRFSRPLSWNDVPEYLQEHLFDGDRNAKKVSIRVPYLICAGTIDEMLTEIVERKRVNFRKSMNKKDENLQWNENEVMKELAEMIVKKRYGKR